MRMGFRLVALALLWPGLALAQPKTPEASGRMVSLVKMPYRGERNLPDLSDSPDYLETGRPREAARGARCRLKPISTVALAPEEQKAYGEWNRLGLANGQLARIVAADRKAGCFPVGPARQLQRPHGHARRAAALGARGAAAARRPRVHRRPRRLQHARDHAQRHAGRHAGGDLGRPRPPAAAAEVGPRPGAARAPHRAGRRCATPTPSSRTSSTARRSSSSPWTTSATRSAERRPPDGAALGADRRHLRPRGHGRARPARRCAGHPLTVPNGPTSVELAAAITQMFTHEKAAALRRGVDAVRATATRTGVSRQAAYNLILGAVEGLSSASQKAGPAAPIRLAPGVWPGPSVGCRPSPRPALVNGRVYTVDAARPWAEAVAISGDRIVAVGRSAEMRPPGRARRRASSTCAGAFVVARLQRRPRAHRRAPARCSWARTCSTSTSGRASSSASRPRPRGCPRGAGSRAATGAPTSSGRPARPEQAGRGRRRAGPSCPTAGRRPGHARPSRVREPLRPQRVLRQRAGAARGRASRRRRPRRPAARS